MGALVAIVAALKSPRNFFGWRCDGRGRGGVGEGNGAVGIYLAEMPSTTSTIGEMVLELTIWQPSGIVDMILYFCPVEGARKRVGAVVVFQCALGIESGR